MHGTTSTHELDNVIEHSKIGGFHYMLLVICGLNFMVDAMEISLLPFLVNCVGVEWELSASKKASIGSAVYAGCLIGCFFWGMVGDRYGRRFTYLAAAFLMAIAGFASAAATSYESLTTIRSIVGFGIGGAHAPYDLLAEFTPQCHHNTFLTAVEYFYTIGSIFVSLLAWLTLDSYGWRWLTALTAIPITFAAFISLFLLPESPRWLLVKGRREEAMEIVRLSLKSSSFTALSTNEDIPETEKMSSEAGDSTLAARSCHSTAELGRPPDLMSTDSKDSTASGDGIFDYFQELYHNKKLRLTTLLLWNIWFSFGITYYGILLFIANVYSLGQKKTQDDASACSFEYSSIFLSAVSEIVGTSIAVAAATRFNRVRAQLAFYVLAGIFAFSFAIMHLINQSMDETSLSSFGPIVQLILSSLARISIFSASTLTWTITPSLIPVQYRSFGHALCVAFSKIGGIISPFIIYLSASIPSQVTANLIIAGILTMINFSAGISLYFISILINQSSSVLLDGKESPKASSKECTSEEDDTEIELSGLCDNSHNECTHLQHHVHHTHPSKPNRFHAASSNSEHIVSNSYGYEMVQTPLHQ